MKIMIHGLNMELTPSISEHVEEKIGALESHLDPKHSALAEARVEVGKETKHHIKGNIFYAEVNVKMGGEFYRATARHEDLYAAVNEVQSDLERQLQKHKTKHEPSRKTIR
ncbi:MAG: ribosome-associated translation inhibitor RaiA [Patescibacteria group bacterium]